MNRPLIAALLAAGLGTAAPGAETISGKVVNAASAPVTGVQVILIPKNITATTGSDGQFQLTVPTTGLSTADPAGVPAISLGDNGIDVMNPRDQRISILVLSTGGEKQTVISDRFMAMGRHGIPMREWAAHRGSGIYILVVSDGRSILRAKMAVTGGRIASLAGAGVASGASVLPKRAAGPGAADSLSFSKTGFTTKKMGLASLATQNLGNIVLAEIINSRIAVGNANYDKHDQHLLESVPRNGMDATMPMVLKAMIMIESTFKVNAISMWDTQLPCGTHSYGLMQVTPGCVRGYATLQAGTETATISGGLNGVTPKLTYANPADEAAGNTIVRENGILINLVSNASNPVYPTSAFNPAYAIEYGAKALSGTMTEMKSRFAGCTAANYVSMALAGYNQGSLTINGCSSFSPNGQAYATKVLTQYRTFCQQAGVPPVY